MSTINEESLDDQEIQILAFTESRGEVRFSDYAKEFEESRGWSHESLMRRIGSEGSLQEKGWLRKQLPKGGKRPVYYIPSEKALRARMIVYALSKKVEGLEYKQLKIDHNKLAEFFGSFEFIGSSKNEARRLGKTLTESLGAIAVDVYSKGKLNVDTNTLRACFSLVRDLIKESKKEPTECKFTIVIDFSFKDGPFRTLELTPGDLVSHYLLEYSKRVKL